MPKRAEIRAVGEFAASRHGAFNMRQAAERGLTRNDVAHMQRAGRIVPVHRNVWRFVGHPVTFRQRAYCATLAAHVAASHSTAAYLLGLDGLQDEPDEVEVLCHHAKPASLLGIQVHRSRSVPNADVTFVEHIRCTTLARTACDIAPDLGHRALVRVIDDIQRRHASMEWVLERAGRLRRFGRSGPAQVMDVVRHRLDGYVVPESWFERMIDECLQSPLLVGLVRQHVLVDDDGDFVARFDLAVPWARLGIECHSRGFHLGELVERYDEDRDIRASKQGWETTYLGFAATRSPVAVRADIEAIVRRRAADFGLSPPSPATI